MNPEGQDNDIPAAGSVPLKNAEALDDFLRARKLQISVLKKILEQIEADPEVNPEKETEEPLNHQNM